MHSVQNFRGAKFVVVLLKKITELYFFILIIQHIYYCPCIIQSTFLPYSNTFSCGVFTSYNSNENLLKCPVIPINLLLCHQWYENEVFSAMIPNEKKSYGARSGE